MNKKYKYTIVKIVEASSIDEAIKIEKKHRPIEVVRNDEVKEHKKDERRYGFNRHGK